MLIRMLTYKRKHKAQGKLPRAKEAIREAACESALSHFPQRQRSVAHPFISSLADPQLSCSIIFTPHFPRHLAKLSWYRAKVSDFSLYLGCKFYVGSNDNLRDWCCRMSIIALRVDPSCSQPTWLLCSLLLEYPL